MYKGGKQHIRRSPYLQWEDEVHISSHTPASGTFSAPITDYALGLKDDLLILQKTSLNPGYERIIKNLQSRGVISRYQLNPTFHDYPPVVSLSVEMSIERGLSESKRHTTSCMLPPGADQNIALSKLIGETLERYVSLWRPAHHPDSQHQFMACAPFSYEDIPHFSQEQIDAFNYFASNEQHLKSLECVSGYNITKGVRAALPSQSVFYGIEHGTCLNEHLFQQATTSGCAGGFSYYQAACSALYELIERDHFFLWWLSGAHPRRIVLDGTPQVQAQVQSLHNEYGIEIYFFDISYDVDVACVMCIAIDRTLNIVSLSARAGASEEVFTSSLGESLVMLSTNRKRIERGVAPKDFSKPFQVFDMGLVQSVREVSWCSPEAVAWLDAYMLQASEVSSRQVQSRFKTYTNYFFEYLALTVQFDMLSTRYGSAYNLYMYEFSHPVLRDFSYTVVRAFVPAFIKLYLSEVFATPFSSRLRQFMSDKKLKYHRDTMNLLPHFFP